MDYKKFFTHPATIITGIILSLGILALVGWKYWGWFTDDELVESPPTNFNCDSTIVENGYTYKFKGIFLSKDKGNYGINVAQFITDETTAKGIKPFIERTISPKEYDLLKKCFDVKKVPTWATRPK